MIRDRITIFDEQLHGLPQRDRGLADLLEEMLNQVSQALPLIRTSVSRPFGEVRRLASLGPITVMRHVGNEPFHDSGSPLGFDLLSFWQWANSDLVSNATRGILCADVGADAEGAVDGMWG